jgi:hypothetical protein
MNVNVFMQSTIAQLIVFICGPASIILSAIFAINEIKKRVKKEIYFIIRSYELIRGGIDQIDGISLTYRGEKIENLSVAKIVIWNGGNISVRKDDIVPVKPIRIFAEDNTRLLEAKVISQIDESNLWNTSNPVGSQLIVNFDYIGNNQGAVFQVLHTGNSDSIKLDGKIIDGQLTELNKAKKKVPQDNSKLMARKKFRKLSFIILTFLLLIMTVVLYLGYFHVLSFVSSDSMQIQPDNFYITMAVTYTLVFFLYLHTLFRKFRFGKKKCPTALEEYCFFQDVLGGQLYHKNKSHNES